jgi:hypothetical protein
MQNPWVPVHRSMGKGEIHYIEVATDSDEEGQDSDLSSSKEET